MNEIIGEIYQNENGWQRRKVVEYDEKNDTVSYNTSYLENWEWSEFKREAFNYCSVKHLKSWGKKISC